MKRDDHQNPDNQQQDLTEDPELNRLLASWQAPESAVELDQRVLANYRRHFNRGRLWRRWLTLSIRVPVPVATAAVLLLCATSFLAVRKATSVSIEPRPAVAPTKFVQVPVPVVQEKIVTRVIRLKTEPGNPKPDSVNQGPGRGADNTAPSDLAGFRPVEEIKILVITEEIKDEK